jgi:3-(3-hydroxy-phenyl)propionate hydroxylase
MCAGMRDAANLAWKLAAVLRHGAPDALLDTYESERLPHVRAFIELAVQLGNVIQATDSGSIAERERRFAARPEVFDFPRPQLGPGCRLDAPPPVGMIFPQPRLADGRLMDEAIGQRFAVVGDAALLEGLATDAVALPGVGTDWLAEHSARAAVLRPDRYVFAVARDRKELEEALRVLAAGGSPPSESP